MAALSEATRCNRTVLSSCITYKPPHGVGQPPAQVGTGAGIGQLRRVTHLRRKERLLVPELVAACPQRLKCTHE